MPHVDPQIFQWQFHKTGLRPGCVEIDNRQNQIVIVRRSFAVADELLVIDCMKLQIVVRLERRILFPNRIYTRDESGQNG